MVIKAHLTTTKEETKLLKALFGGVKCLPINLDR